MVCIGFTAATNMSLSCKLGYLLVVFCFVLLSSIKTMLHFVGCQPVQSTKVVVKLSNHAPVYQFVACTVYIFCPGSFMYFLLGIIY